LEKSQRSSRRQDDGSNAPIAARHLGAASVATAVLAAVVFAAQAMTSEKLTAALFYILVVLLRARFCNARGVVLVGAGCVGLTLLAFFLPGLTDTDAGNVA
jgi:hypothetical protein